MNLTMPYLGHAGDLLTEINPGKGDPWGEIQLTEKHGISLRWLTEDDCDRLIKAAAEVKQKIIDSRAKAAAPHEEWKSIPYGGCLICGKQEDDPLHAPVITDSERTCDQANPGTGAWCHRDGGHGVHEDTDGQTWRTDGEPDPGDDPDYDEDCDDCRTVQAAASVTA